MLALEMDKSYVKTFMGKLLREDLFDSFEARLVEISTTTRITIDGAIEASNMDTAETEAASPIKAVFTLWGSTRPLVYEIIKLCAKPRQIKIIFAYHAPQEIHTNAAALFLNFVYENDGVTFTTATAQKQFEMDKSLDTEWDEHIREFFANTGIDVADRE